jgi:hypothetical protein
VCPPDSTSHARPWLLESKHTFDIVTVDLLAGDWVDDRWFDTEEWKRSTSWLRWCYTCKWSDDIGSGLGLPVCLQFVSKCLNYKKDASYINNVSLLFSNGFKVPFPNFSSDGLTNRAQNSQVLHLMLDMLISSSLE